MVLFGEQLDGENAARVGLAWRCVDDEDLLAEASRLAARAAAAPPALVRRTKATIMSLPDVTTSDAAVAHELEPQVWSMEQPAFQELIGQLQRNLRKT
jgi:enoyl-CoA hydratase